MLYYIILYCVIIYIYIFYIQIIYPNGWVNKWECLNWPKILLTCREVNQSGSILVGWSIPSAVLQWYPHVPTNAAVGDTTWDY